MVYRDKIVEVPKYVEVIQYVPIIPPETERGDCAHPQLEGEQWKDVLTMVGDYKQALDGCNLQIDRIWSFIDSASEDVEGVTQ